MAYRITGIDPAPFAHLYGLDDAALARHGAARKRIGEHDEIPERVELRDAPIGSDVLLVNYTHQPAKTPYHARYAVFIREGATETASVVDVVPEVLAKRLIALRAFDGRDFLTAFDIVPGTDLEPLILDYLSRPEVAYLHAHYAKPGCFAAHVRRT